MTDLEVIRKLVDALPDKEGERPINETFAEMGGPEDWRHRVPQVVRDCWPELPLTAQLVVFLMVDAEFGGGK